MHACFALSFQSEYYNYVTAKGFEMGLVLVVIVLFSHGCLCNAQDFVSGMDCDETKNCTEEGCIRTYHELDLYIKGNKELMENLTSVFFVTGKTPSQFVKLTYNFQVLNEDNNSTGDNESNVMNCSNHQTTYIWSEKFIYLLGPKPLITFTLFAVIVSENEVTIYLPCLCYDVYNNLLSRLTYLVRMHIRNYS